MVEKRKLLVIGAGASGLPSLRNALQYNNVDVVCFEGSGHVGGLWKYKPEDTELSSVMKSTVINTSKEMTAYSDFPPEEQMANFMHNTEMYRYLLNYAKHHQLHKYIKFHHKVNSIDRNWDYDKTGKWKVNYTDDEGVTDDAVFDGVMLCSGHHKIPHWPQNFVDQDKFNGRIIHSHSYKDQRGYDDKTVVVIGIGNSGGDVAVELSRIAKQVYLVTRRGTWVFNRMFDRGVPSDIVLNRKFISHLKAFIPEWLLNTLFEYKLNQRFDHKNYGLKPEHRVFEAHPTINDELANRIANGTIRIKPNVSRFTKTGIIFEDGTKLEHVDEVIMSTGYSFELNLIEKGELIPVKDNHVELYKFIFPVKLSEHNTLAIIGLAQPFGSIMPFSEMQARFYLEIFTGNIMLPSRSDMQKDIQKIQEEMARIYVESRRHTLQIDFITYMEDLADRIGCKVNLMKLWRTDPKLAYKVLFGPMVPYVFRLTGPNKWKHAREAIMGVDKRILKATNDKAVIESDNSLLYIFGVVLFSSVPFLLRSYVKKQYKINQ